MPELIEVELYRQVAERAVGAVIAGVDAPDLWYLKRSTTPDRLAHSLVGEQVVATRRIGKLLLLDTTGPTVGLRFGMTGRLVVDGHVPIERLEYSSSRNEPGWVRFRLLFEERGALEMVDPRRLGGVELEPDSTSLGPDAAAVGPAALRDRLARSRAPLKAWLLDQSHIAGIGNLIADETLWRAGLDPGRPAASVEPREVRRLVHHLRATIAILTERGGSHTGDLHEARRRGATCPRDGAPLLRRTIGGRTTYSCPRHQR